MSDLTVKERLEGLGDGSTQLSVLLENPVVVFRSPENLDIVLSGIEQAAFLALEGANLETAKGRKIYASAKRKVASSKVAIDDAGKAITTEWRDLCNVVDGERKRARDFLDDLGIRAREPLTTWEKAEAEIKAKAEALAEYLEDWESAIHANGVVDFHREVEKKAAELKKREAEIKAKEDEAKFEAEREEREEQLKIKAVQDAKAKIQRIADEKAEKFRQDNAHRETIDAEAFSSMIRNGISPILAGKMLRLLKAGEISNVRICY